MFTVIGVSIAVKDTLRHIPGDSNVTCHSLVMRSIVQQAGVKI